MLPMAINHMSAPNLGWRQLLKAASELGCIGVEFRNDLSEPLFSGDRPEDVSQAATRLGLRIVGLSQVYPFNSWGAEIEAEVASLIETARRCGAETISLIPRNDGTGRLNGERQANLRLALREIRPMLEESGMIALVEPLGFERSSLRYKAETIEAIEAIGGAAQYRIVHDTFHHFLAGETEYYPEYTGMIHVSGVVDPKLAVNEMEDEHRVLVDARDRLGNVDQIRALRDMGYSGPISFEAFSPEVHALADPVTELKKSIDFINSRVTAHAA